MTKDALTARWNGEVLQPMYYAEGSQEIPSTGVSSGPSDQKSALAHASVWNPSLTANAAKALWGDRKMR